MFGMTPFRFTIIPERENSEIVRIYPELNVDPPHLRLRSFCNNVHQHILMDLSVPLCLRS